MNAWFKNNFGQTKKKQPDIIKKNTLEVTKSKDPAKTKTEVKKKTLTEAEARAKAEEKARQNAEAEAKAKAEEEAKLQKQKLAALKRYDGLTNNIIVQKAIISQNRGWFGKSAKRRKAAEEELALLEHQLHDEFPNGKPN